jgi:hypothetical protein
MPITALPPAPSRTLRPADFANQADTFLAALPAFGTEANALAEEVNGVRDATAVIKTETQAIKDAAVAETQAIKDAAVAETQAIKDAAETIRDQAAGSATAAANSAAIASARAAEAAASANFIGPWSGLSGPLNMPASVLHNGRTWRLLANLPDVTASEPGVSGDWDQSSSLSIVSYEDRGTLRTAPEVPGTMAIVDGLGLFTWHAGSDEPDDDESCFATATGRWLLEAAHWDVVDTWQLPDDDARDAWDEDEQQRFASSFASSFASKVLFGTATCAISSVAATSSVSFTGTVTGAAVGDRVIATPPAQLGSDAANTSRLAYHAWVSAPNTVTIMLTNASAAAATVNSAVQTAWPITVIKA